MFWLSIGVVHVHSNAAWMTRVPGICQKNPFLGWQASHQDDLEKVGCALPIIDFSSRGILYGVRVGNLGNRQVQKKSRRFLEKSVIQEMSYLDSN